MRNEANYVPYPSDERSYDPTRRIDVPTDYHQLWNRLRHRLTEMRAEAATRAATEREIIMVRRHQGAHDALSRILTEMEQLVDVARAEKRPVS